MKKFKHLIIISLTFLVLTFILSIVLGFTTVQIPELIEKNINSYKFACGIRIFCDLLPAIIGTSFVLGWAFDFGDNYEGSLSRFSTAMFSRYKLVLCSAIIITFLLTCFSEFVQPANRTKMKNFEEMPKLQKEYKNFAKRLYDSGRYELSLEFAERALKINPKDKEASQLFDMADIAAKQIDFNKANSSSLDMTSILPSKIETETSLIDTTASTTAKNAKKISEPYKLLLTAKQCLVDEDWFGAHFYAQQAISITTPRDVNYNQFKQIAAEAWNKLSQAKFMGTSEEQLIFSKKFEGYSALTENDNLHAYYVFKTLSNTSKTLSLDPDVQRYLAVSEERLEKQFFFTDETLNLQSFENAHNVYFRLNHPDNSYDLYFIKGITSTGKKNNLIQYLRGLSIFCIDKDGNYVSGSYTPYAKLKEISTGYFNDSAKKSLEIDEKTQTVPYIILNSVDRNREGIINSAMLFEGETQFSQKGYIIFPFKYEDFNLIKEASAGIETMNLITLFKFAPIAEKYGYASEIYTQSILNRLLYPIFILICLMALGIGAWHGRLPPNSTFKFKWIIVFPIFTAVDYIVYKFVMFFFQLINYSLLGIARPQNALLTASGFYILIFIIISVLFTGCKNSMTKLAE